MYEQLISGDNHIDLTYCPTDLWSSQAPAKWKNLVPRVREDDRAHVAAVGDQSRGALAAHPSPLMMKSGSWPMRSRLVCR